MVISFLDPTGRYASNRADSKSFPLVCNVNQQDNISSNDSFESGYFFCDRPPLYRIASPLYA